MGFVIIQLPSQMLAKRCVRRIKTVLPVIAIKIPIKKRVAVMLSTQVHHQDHQAHRVRVTLMLNIAKRVILLVNIV